MSTFEPHTPQLEEAWRRYGQWRIGRTGLVMEALTPAIIEQKVTGQEAFAGFRMLVHRYGERAPGPGAERQALGPAGRRHHPAGPVVGVAADAHRPGQVAHAGHAPPGWPTSLERTVGLPGDEVERRLTSLPGIGVWTAAEVRQRAHGDADAVSFGDYHVAQQVGWAVRGSDFDDAEMAEYLEPWRPHRGRVVTLLLIAGPHRPRHGARMAPRTHLPARVTRR